MKKELILFLFICPLVFFYVFSNQFKKAGPKYDTNLTLHDSFRRLQGEGTKDWDFIQTSADFKDLEMYEKVYEKNKHCQFNGSPGLKIPKLVHLIWIGPKPFPRESIENVRSWMAYHPDWTFIFWTDRKRPPPCNGVKVKLLEDFEFSYLKERFEESTNWGEKADMWRYEILLKMGGTYIDHDVRCCRPFHNLHTGYDFYVGLEMPHSGIDQLSITAGIGVIGARPNHPLLIATIEKVLERWDQVTKEFAANDPFVRAQRVTHRTLVPMTHAIKGALNQGGNTDIVFPACYFYPKHGLPGFYTKHLYGTSWHDLYETPAEKVFITYLQELRNRDAKIIRVELFCLFALIGCFVVYFLMNREIERRS